MKNATAYRVEGESGRFEFITHKAVGNDGRVFDAARDFLVGLSGKQRYRTEGFNEIALIHGCVDMSYRKTAKALTRIRHQEASTSSETLRYYVESEGDKIIKNISEQSREIFTDYGFDENGVPFYGRQRPVPSDALASPERVLAVVKEVAANGDFSVNDLISNPVAYENPDATVNVSVDDVGVKKQKDIRDKKRIIINNKRGIDPANNYANIHNKKTKRERIQHTVAHIQSDRGCYALVGYGVAATLSLVTAFLLKNKLMRRRVVFFVDGQRSLKNHIVKLFDWSGAGIILDWYHIPKKCSELLSLAMSDRDARNHALKDVKKLIWHGLVDQAQQSLKRIDRRNIKNPKAIADLIGYLERNRNHIPCYAARERLGLRNSSNIGEKMNDLIVSERQKNNGMSWTRSGSTTLAALNAIKINQEHHAWFEKRTIPFKMVA